MKHNKILIFILSLLFIIIPSNAFAAEPIGFQTSEIGEDKLDSYLNSFSVSLLTEAPENLSIKCFDVNESGLIAIGSQTGEDCYIHIYNSDSDFNFLYGFYFNCSGTYEIEWNNDYINIYYVRSDIAATYDSTGQIINIAKIDNTIENNSYWNSLKRNKKQVNHTEYKVKNDMGALNLLQSSYSQLIKIDDLGNEIILYDVNSFQLAKTITIFIVITFLVAIVILIVINKEKEKKQNIKVQVL